MREWHGLSVDSTALDQYIFPLKPMTSFARIFLTTYSTQVYEKIIVVHEQILHR